MQAAQRAPRVAGRAARFDYEPAERLLTAAAQLEAEGRDVVRLDLGEPDFATPAHIVEVAVRALRDGVTHYTAPGGTSAARVAVAAHVARTRGVEVQPRQVVLTSGSTQALLFAMLALVERGQEVLLQDPCYAIYPAMAQLADGRAVPVPPRPGSDRLDVGALRALIGPRSRVLLLNSPNNPTGCVLPAEDLAAIAELAERHDLLVISDEIYGDLVHDGHRAPSLLAVPGMAERTILVDGFSKAFAMCGWRIGYAVAPLDIARRLESIMLAGGLCAPSFAQAAVAEALGSPASAAAVDAMRREFARRRDTMIDGLNRIPGVRCHRPEGAFYAFPDVTAIGVPDVELADRLLREGGVTALPGSIFGPSGRGHLRLSYATSAERITEGLRRIACVLAD